MPDPIEITEADLFAEIGRLYVENKVVRNQLAQSEREKESLIAATEAAEKARQEES